MEFRFRRCPYASLWRVSALELHSHRYLARMAALSAPARTGGGTIPFVIKAARSAALVSCLLLSAVACSQGEPRASRAAAWDPAGAAAYLDRRINWWMSWKISARDHGTFCVSCHTAVPYALARANLATALGDSAAGPERRLLQDV